MSALDVGVIALIIVAGVGGYRLGFVTRVVSWIGMGLGLLVAVRLLPTLVSRFRGSGSETMLLITLGVIFAGAMAGQALGFALGSRMRPRRLGRIAIRVDRVAGAASGVIGVLALLWLTIPVLAGSPGTVADQTRKSVIAQTLDDHLPHAPDSMQTLRSFVGEENFPTVFDALRPTPDLGPPPEASGLDGATSDRVKRSVVKVEGIACNRVQDGTGFVVAPGYVVTNAHVVAGESETELELDDDPGSRVKATVVAFDPRRDLAVLHAPDLTRPPLTVVDSAVGASGGVFGHPGGGPLRIAPFDVARELHAVGRDIYGTGVTTREVLEVRSSLRPGDSGSALISTKGEVVGVAFAIAPDKAGVAYALSTSELQTVLGGDLTHTTSTGPCTGEG
jgi:S1-C subfamily serine protease